MGLWVSSTYSGSRNTSTITLPDSDDKG